jgi:hypothetical protein
MHNGMSPPIAPAHCRLCNDEGCTVCETKGIEVGGQDSDELQELQIVAEPTKRFEVTLQHTIVVYDESEDQAKARAPLLYQKLFHQPAARPLEVVSVRELVSIAEEPQSGIIDVSPILQRK